MSPLLHFLYFRCKIDKISANFSSGPIQFLAVNYEIFRSDKILYHFISFMTKTFLLCTNTAVTLLISIQKMRKQSYFFPFCAARLNFLEIV
jgi:hypothetical protein